MTKGTSSGCKSANCGKSGSEEGFQKDVWDKIKDHPCYSVKAHNHFARMHVSVAPACNIQCNYCNRKYDCANESRPGVVSERLSPVQAQRKVLSVASKLPQLSVVGIAGPGDALANPDKTFETFRLIRQEAPDIKLCLSTNGLVLPEYIDEIAKYDVEHVTLTINMIDPRVGEKIYPWVYFEKKKWVGIEASEILHRQQMKSLELLKEAGILCKVNSVLIPGVNDKHLADVSKEIKKYDVFLHNIVPLISRPEHGTYFGKTGVREPTPQELKSVQDQSEGDVRVMRHCRQCRADAIGMLNEDIRDEFQDATLESTNLDSGEAARSEYRKSVIKLQKRVDDELKSTLALDEYSKEFDHITLTIAITTSGGGRINQHFGHASEFQVYEVTTSGCKYVSHRSVDTYCQGGYGDDEALDTYMSKLKDCHAILVSKVGRCPRETFNDAGIEISDKYAYKNIEEGLLSYLVSHLDALKDGSSPVLAQT